MSTYESSQFLRLCRLLDGHLAQADIEDLLSRLERRRADVKDTVDATWPEKGRVLRQNAVEISLQILLPNASSRRTMTSGRLVAATTVTPTSSSTPSISFKIEVRMPLVCDEPLSSREVPSASISSCSSAVGALAAVHMIGKRKGETDEEDD